MESNERHYVKVGYMSTWAMLQAFGLAMTLGCFMEVLNFSEDLFADRASDGEKRTPSL